MFEIGDGNGNRFDVQGQQDTNVVDPASRLASINPPLSADRDGDEQTAAISADTATLRSHMHGPRPKRSHPAQSIPSLLQASQYDFPPCQV